MNNVNEARAKQKQGHTSGKWQIEGKKTTLNNYKITSDGISICQVFTSNIYSEANAKLISAAPDLLEACQIAVGDIERNEKKFTAQEKLRILREAIQKATEQ